MSSVEEVVCKPEIISKQQQNLSEVRKHGFKRASPQKPACRGVQGKPQVTGARQVQPAAERGTSGKQNLDFEHLLSR